MSEVQASGAAFWDVVGEQVREDSFAQEHRSLKEKLAKYESNPGGLRFWSRLWLAGGVLVSFALIVAFVALAGGEWNIDGDFLYAFIFAFIPYATYRAMVARTVRGLVSLLVAERKHWAYRSQAPSERMTLLRKCFPEIFNRGHSQKITEEWWGSCKGGAFWIADYEYTVGSGKHAHTYKQHVFASKLPRTLHTNFSLVPESGFARLFGGKDAQVELEEFNRAFRITIGSGDLPGEQELRRVLSPVLQLQFLEARKQDAAFSIALRGDAAVFLTAKPPFGALKTNFFKKVELHPDDERAIDEGISKRLSFIETMLPYLD